ncbi:hypothetical protein JCM3774_005266 [Rhodotorula dairenensis]
MVGVLTLASIYVLGGLTFLPLCVAAFLAFLFYTSPVVHLPRKTGVTAASVPTQDDDAETVTVYRAGWLVARRTYEPSKDSGDGTYVGMLTSSYKSFMDNRSKDPRRARPKDRFYAVLKHKTLYLYESEDQTECWAAIELPGHDVVITPEGYLDGELFAKRTAIELRPKAESVVDSLLDAPTAEKDSTPSWFIFARVNSDKEDWYHSLVLASRLGSPTAAANVARDQSLFDAEDMARLVEVIDQQPDSIPMRWFNALLGRVFLAVYRTKSVEEYITSRIVRKLKRVKLPAMLSEIQVREVQVGASVPLFSKPMLKDLNAEGDASMETHVAYVGNARVTIETVATISLGSRFKPYTVRLVLAVVLKELEGTMLFKIKKPPSNRIWFGFTQMPKMVLSVEPVVSTRQLKWSLVTGPIESRIRELVMEALVLPHMDDVAFFNTSSAPFSRGGIYGDFLRDPEPTREEELNGPKRDDREATHDDPGEEEFVGGGGTEGGEEPSPAVGTSSAVNQDTAAGLRPTAASRRRRSSEGDHPQSNDVSKSAESTRSSSKTTSVSSLAGLGASFAHWREQAKNGSTSGGVKGGGDKSNLPARKSTWFGNSTKATSGILAATSGPASASAPDLITRTPSVLSVASTDTNTSTLPSVGGGNNNDDTRGREEISAAKLRDILSKRAESREREREREREIERAREIEADAVVARAGRIDLATPAPMALQEESASAVPDATSDDASARTVDSAMADAPEPAAFVELCRAESAPSPSRLDETDAAAASAEAEPSPPSHGVLETPELGRKHGAGTPPTLPTRPTWVKSHSPAPTASVASSIAPDADSPAFPAPPPTHPRHAGSASVDSGGATLSTSASTLLSTWRTRAADKEALAAGVASAKESMRRWGANWAAKRATKESLRGEDFDKVVGESPEKRRDGSADRYREHRRERENRDHLQAGSAATAIVPAPGPAGGYFGGLDAELSKPLPIAPAMPARGRAGSAAAAETASSSASTPRLVPSASTPSLALSPSTATAEGSPSSSPAKPTMIQHLSSASASPSGTSTMPYAGGYGSQGSGGMSAYGRRTMALPGIRNEDRKKKVAEDHLSSTIGGAAPTAYRAAEPTAVGVPAPDATPPSAKPDVATEPALSLAASSTKDVLASLSSSPPPLSSIPSSPPPLPVRKKSDESSTTVAALSTFATPNKAPTAAAATMPGRTPPPLPAREEQATSAAHGEEATSVETSSPSLRPALPARPSEGNTIAKSELQRGEEVATDELNSRVATPTS